MKKRIIIAIILTLAYLAWETQAEGNIRIDLLIIYPVLFTSYLLALWRKFKFYAILIALGLMAGNYYFQYISYDLFDKFPG